ncbi:WD40 repeat protein [Kribbella rubisoli]|uniref:WD40 repeat protein n=1 Tax=Kribbella rubisoli TaxID=3075929 RepID=A0A4V2FUC1_9ACTN|nr:WD40 repeat protein [Kribbella rubisoli]
MESFRLVQRPIRTVLAVVAVAAVVGGGASAPAVAGDQLGDSIDLVSVTPAGVGGDGESAAGTQKGLGVSAHGRYVVFSSYATDLVPGDTNGQRDVFVRDLVRGRTTRVSVGDGGVQGNGESREGSISADGRYVAFTSFASNLVPGDTNGGEGDVFLRDLKTGRTTLVSVGSQGQGNLSSVGSEISADGSHVAFTSAATNLVVGDTNDTQDVFVRDLRTQRTERVSVSSDGGQLNTFSNLSAISGDGRRVAFGTPAELVPVPPAPPITDIILYVRDRTADKTRPVSLGATHDPRSIIVEAAYPSFSNDGRYVVFTQISWLGVGIDPIPNVWLRDLRTNRLQLISADSQGNPSTAVGPVFRSGVSADGRYVTFSTPALLTSGDSGILADVFRLDRKTGSLVWITHAQDQTDPFGGRIGSVGPAISADGQHVAFESDDKQLTPGGGMFGRDTYLWNAVRPS